MQPRITYDIQHKTTTVSTNDDVMALGRAGAPEGTVVVAEAQSGGRGRLGGRVWTSPRGNAYFSFLVRPACGQDRVATLSLVVALAVHAAFESMGVSASLKYPNDVFVGDKKITGILLESGGSTSGTFVVIGVGIDIFRTDVADNGASNDESGTPRVEGLLQNATNLPRGIKYGPRRFCVPLGVREKP